MSLLTENTVLIEQAKKYLEINGVAYNLSEWVTLKTYASQHAVKSISVLSNWIKRGIIPSQDLLVVSELNNLKLIKNKMYVKNKR